MFDASHPTASGVSLNDILAKGMDNLNKLPEILIRWLIYQVGIHSDIRKMYNKIKLDKSHWCFQRYIWQSELDRSKIPQEKIIKTSFMEYVPVETKRNVVYVRSPTFSRMNIQKFTK